MDRNDGACCGKLQALYEAEIHAIEREQLLERLWAQDISLWPSGEEGPEFLKQNLEFLRIPDTLPQALAGVMQVAAESESEGLTDRLLISFGSVHYFCRAMLNIHPDGASRRCVALESGHPGAIRQAEAQMDLRKTLILLVNKSGYQLEDHSLFLYFLKKLQDEVAGKASRQFVAASERNSFLATMAAEYSFRSHLELPGGITAPYCSLIFLAVLLLGVADVEPEVLRTACRDMKRLYADGSSALNNPVGELAAFLGASARDGRRIVNFLAPASLAPFAAALCPLAGRSLGKGEAGLFPLIQMLPCATQPFESTSSFVVFRNGGETDSSLEQCVSGLRERGAPFLELTVASPLDLLRQTYRWQIATALAASRMGLNPFEEPDVRQARILAADMLNGLAAAKDTLQRRPRIQEGSLQLFAEERARREISQLNLVESLVSFFRQHNAVGYISLLVFLQPEVEAERLFTAIHEELSLALRLPVLLAWGPRSLETHGYLFSEGAPRGLHLMITGDSGMDLKIPGAHYTFARLFTALALGQFETLSALDGLALRVHIGPQIRAVLDKLQGVIIQALKRLKP